MVGNEELRHQALILTLAAPTAFHDPGYTYGVQVTNSV